MAQFRSGEVIDLGNDGWGIKVSAKYQSRREAEEVLANLDAELLDLEGSGRSYQAHPFSYRIMVESREATAAAPELVFGYCDHGPLLRRVAHENGKNGHVRLSGYSTMNGGVVPVYLDRYLEDPIEKAGIRIWRVDS